MLSETRIPGKRWLLRCVKAFGVVAAVAAVLVVVLVINNWPPNILIPAPRMPKDNAWDDFVAASRLIDTTHYGPYSDSTRALESWKVTDFAPFLRGNVAAVARLRVALAKPYLLPPLRTSVGFSRQSQAFAMFREMARVLAGEAMYYDLAGKPDKAADSLLDCGEFGATLPHGGSIYPTLVGTAVGNIGMRSFPNLLPKLSRTDLAHVAERLEHIRRKQTSFSDAILEERWTAAGWLTEALRDRSQLTKLDSVVQWSGMAGDGFWSGVGYAFANKTAMLHRKIAYYQALAAEQRNPYTGASAVPVPGNVLFFQPKALIRSREPLEERDARLALLQTEVALRRYRFDHGKYPDRASQLVPAYLKSVPVDPFGLGKPLRYKPLDNARSFLLYSLGPDLKDDGGKTGKWMSADTKGDMVLGKW